MKKPPIPPDEAERLAKLASYQILDTLPEREYDDLTALAAHICKTPIALISLIDEGRQWFKSAVGLDAPETPRDISFCGHVVADREMLVVQNATDDTRFADNPLVTGPPDIRFYAGAPLVTPDDHYLGTLCVIDSNSRELSSIEETMLLALSRQVVSQLELRLKLKQLESTRTQIEEALRSEHAASQAKSLFLANMSHELRTPLNAIIGYSEMLSEEAEETGLDFAAADLGRIQGAGKHLLFLINDILDLSKIEAGKFELYPEWFNVAAMATETAEFIQPMMDQNKNSLTLEIAPDIGVLHADPSRTKQCLLNLLSNAAKFTQNGRVTLSVRELETEAEKRITFAVEDTGIGIGPEDMEKIFKRFEQVSQGHNRRFTGTGIGLPLSKYLATQMGGDIQVVSEPDRGSLFTLILPREDSASAQPPR
ncbi:MAG: HAMP domain-containing histidine kinase [Gemmatimonadetes bacterium]|nr:HAMP domain-containing histidine kinase [Gemmatimonadota bacterium]